MTTNGQTAYQQLQSDPQSPLFRVYRINSWLNLLRMALYSNEALGEFGSMEVSTLQGSTVDLCGDVERLIEEMEGYFMKYRLVGPSDDSVEPEPSKI